MKALLRALWLVLILAALPATARAQDGYDLWLRYPQVNDAARLREYRATAASLLVDGSSPTLAAARDELMRGLSGLLGRSPRPVASPARVAG